jgi:hypothetical protein
MLFSQTPNPIWVNFKGSCKRRCCYIFRPFGIFCCHLVYLKGYMVFFSRLGMLY